MESVSHPGRPPRSSKHLINIIATTRRKQVKSGISASSPDNPTYVLFLGAGASVTSGVKTTTQMIDEWRDSLWKSQGSDDREIFLKQFLWYGQQEEYSSLFELVYDLPSQRRDYIETCLAKASPSWGYIYLVNFIRHGVFNTIFTTNFDDLLNEACYKFSSEVRPIVCSHDSSIKTIRVASKRPKIIKLHGDFLYDDIKNTSNELETLENNMREKFRQYASEHGFIFVGYGGNDRSIMDALNVLLQSKNNFPHGIYWCILKGSKIHPNVEALTRFPAFNLVEIAGFDSFFAEMRGRLELELQPEVFDPYVALRDALNGFVEKAKISSDGNEIIDKDMDRLASNIERMERALDGTTEKMIFDASSDSKIPVQLEGSITEIPVPFRFLAQAQERKGNIEIAQKYMLKQLDTAPTRAMFEASFELLLKKPNLEFQAKLVKHLCDSTELLAKDSSLGVNMAVKLMGIEQYDDAVNILQSGFEASRKSDGTSAGDLEFYIINMALIKRLRGVPLTEEQVGTLEAIVSRNDIGRITFASLLLLDEFGAAEDVLKKLILNKKAEKELATAPIMTLMAGHITDSIVISWIENSTK